MPNLRCSGFRSGFSDLHAGRVTGLWQLPCRWLVGKRPSPLDDHTFSVSACTMPGLIGVPAGAVAPVLIAHEPVGGAQRADRRADRQALKHVHTVTAEDHELA